MSSEQARIVDASQIRTLSLALQPGRPPDGRAACGTGYVAIDGSSRLLSSPDFLTWTIQAAPFINGGALPGAVAWGANTFVAVGNVSSTQSRVALSTDGVTWTDGPLVDFVNSRVVWDGSRFIMTSRGNLGRPPLATSPDGTTWTTHAFPPLVAACAATGAGVTVIGLILGNRGSLTDVQRTIWTSPDLSTWTYRLNPFDYDDDDREAQDAEVWDVAWNGSMFVAVGIATWTGVSEPSRSIMTSPDGITWTARPSAFDTPAGGTTRGLARGVAWNGSVWVAVGSGPETFVTGHPEIGGPFICTSPDGITWTRVVLANLDVDPAGPSWDQGWDVDAAAGLAVAGGDPRTFFDSPFAYSADGINWTVPDAYSGEGPFMSVAIGGGAACGGGQLAGTAVRDTRLSPRMVT